MMISVVTSGSDKELFDSDLIICATLCIDVGENCDPEESFYKVVVACTDKTRTFYSDTEDEADQLMSHLCSATTAYQFDLDHTPKNGSSSKSTIPNSDISTNAVAELLSD